MIIIFRFSLQYSHTTHFRNLRKGWKILSMENSKKKDDDDTKIQSPPRSPKDVVAFTDKVLKKLFTFWNINLYFILYSFIIIIYIWHIS